MYSIGTVFALLHYRRGEQSNETTNIPLLEFDIGVITSLPIDRCRGCCKRPNWMQKLRVLTTGVVAVVRFLVDRTRAAAKERPIGVISAVVQHTKQNHEYQHVQQHLLKQYSTVQLLSYISILSNITVNTRTSKH